VPTNYPYEEFKGIYLYAHEQGLKGCTTFRFNPEAFQGVLVKEEDLKNTVYVFTLEDGTESSRCAAMRRSTTTAKCTAPPICLMR
jgi:ribonucleoside-diphosphate reductase alpha chain